MYPGRGYWVLATEATTLTIANEGPDPVVDLISPVDLDVVTDFTDVIGTVREPDPRQLAPDLRAHRRDRARRAGHRRRADHRRRSGDLRSDAAGQRSLRADAGSHRSRRPGRRGLDRCVGRGQYEDRALHAVFRRSRDPALGSRHRDSPHLRQPAQGRAPRLSATAGVSTSARGPTRTIVLRATVGRSSIQADL